MTFFDLLDAFLLILPMVWLACFTATADSWLIHFVVGSLQKSGFPVNQSLSCTVIWGSSFPGAGLHSYIWCGIFLLVHFSSWFRSPWVAALYSDSTSHLGIFSKLFEGACYLFIEFVNKIAEGYWSCYWTPRDTTSSHPPVGLCPADPLNSACHLLCYPLMYPAQPIISWMTEHII